MQKREISSVLPVVAFDALCVIASPIIALLLRNNLDISIDQFVGILPYTLVYTAVATICFGLFDVYRGLWSYASVPDVYRIAQGALISILITLLIAFAATRLENVPRSLPLIQLLVIVAAMGGARGIYRQFCFRRNAAPECGIPPPVQVLLVGLNDIADAYLGIVERLSNIRFSVAGILAEQTALHGRQLRALRVDGSPTDLALHLQRYDVHGIKIQRVVVCVPWRELSASSQRALLDAEELAGVEVERFADRLGLSESKAAQPVSEEPEAQQKTLSSEEQFDPTLGGYAPLKRLIDFTGAVALIILLAPVLLAVSLLVVLDVGLPVAFWQQRPGRFGVPFRVYKFRTMLPPFRSNGQPVAPHKRVSPIGRMLRGSRLDELPQLFNIVLGHMSFVGPRPLLPIDQPRNARARLMVRPGLTGWAQVNGGRDVSIEEKDALDRWYARHASLALDLWIVLKTVLIVIQGDRRNSHAIRTALIECGLPARADHGSAQEEIEVQVPA